MYRNRLVCAAYTQMNITENQTRRLMYIVDSFVMVFGETSAPRHKRGCLDLTTFWQYIRNFYISKKPE